MACWCCGGGSSSDSLSMEMVESNTDCKGKVLRVRNLRLDCCCDWDCCDCCGNDPTDRGEVGGEAVAACRILEPVLKGGDEWMR
jgi:hypothetical protein